MTFVLAGNYNQYLSFCHEKKINPKGRDFVYLHPHDIYKTAGLENWKIEKYGTWYENYSTDFLEKLYARQRAYTR